MCGVSMGERVLQIGIDDPSLVGALAAKVGLSGHAAIAVVDDRAAVKARMAAEDAAVLVDVQVTALGSLPFPEDGFDAVVLHAVTGGSRHWTARLGSRFCERLSVCCAPVDAL